MPALQKKELQLQNHIFLRSCKVERNVIYNGDALNILKTFPDQFVNCIVTSPPYWKLRNYGKENQLGQEKQYQDYINRLCDIFDEAKRVLRDDGTCWVNIGDTYLTKYVAKSGIGRKNLSLIPFRFAIEMQNRGWIVRNVIIWKKENAVPLTSPDRFTPDFEYVFFFVKNPKYYFSQQYEKLAASTVKRAAYRYVFSDESKISKGHYPFTQNGIGNYAKKVVNGEINRRAKRCVWTVNTVSFKEDHFATFPPKLIIPMIKAGCPEYICSACGKPYTENKKPACQCNSTQQKGVVLDMFMGSGTTAVVSLNLNRDFVGIEINENYINIANKRIETVVNKIKEKNKYVQLSLFEKE